MSEKAVAPGAAPPSVVADTPSKREIRFVFLGLMIVLSLGAIDQSVVATALPRIVSDLGGFTALSWVVSAYVLTSTIAMPLYGKLSDQYGRKPILYVAILIFLLGSALSGLSRSLPQLIIFRAIQGLGAGGLLPLAQIIIGDLVPPAERGRRQGAIVAVFAVCSITGPVLGGVITDLLSWHWIFYINLPLGVLSLAVIAKVLHQRQPLRSRRIDYLGAFLLTIATAAFLLLLTFGGSSWAWLSPQAGLCAALCLLPGIAFVSHIQRVPEPILPPALFQDRLFIIACTVLTLTFMGMMGSSLFFPLFFQLVEGISASYSGLLTGPLMVGVVCASVFNGHVLLRSGRYKPTQIAGLAIAVVGFAGLAWAMATTQSLFVIEPMMFGLGIGLGLVMPNMTIAVQNGLPAEHRGVGTATLAFFRSLGGLVGVAGSGAILSVQVNSAMPASVMHGKASPLSQEAAQWISKHEAVSATVITIYRHAITTVFAMGVCIVALALVVILFMPELPLSPVRHAPSAKAR